LRLRAAAVLAFWAIRPKSAGTHINLGAALEGQGKLAEAETEYRRAILLRPDYSMAHFNLGNLLTRQAKLAEAIRLKPDLVQVNHYLGIALVRQKRLDEAIAEYREAIRLNPDCAAAYSDLVSDQRLLGATAGSATGWGRRGARRTTGQSPATSRARRSATIARTSKLCNRAYASRAALTSRSTSSSVMAQALRW